MLSLVIFLNDSCFICILEDRKLQDNEQVATSIIIIITLIPS